jgi:hypothetical protein
MPMRVFTLYPSIVGKATRLHDLRELLPDGQIREFPNYSNADDCLSKFYAAASPLKQTARNSTAGRRLNAGQQKTVAEFKDKLFACIREIAKVGPGEQFWVVFRSDVTDSDVIFG